MWQSLKNIGQNHFRLLLATFALVGAENLLFLCYPLFGGFAVNAVMNEQVWQSLTYGLLVLLMWGIGGLRRSVDTRAFTHIYTQIAVPVILKQRSQAVSVSAITARVALSREFVNFFEEHLPQSITSILSIAGACLMLMVLEWPIGLFSLLILLLFLSLLPWFSRMSEGLYGRLNNRLEQDNHHIRQSDANRLWRHYRLVARLRVLISNREALGYFLIGTAMSVLFGFSFVYLSLHGYQSAGHVYSITTYLWMFAMALDDAPRLVENYSNLKDIAQRVQVG